jgi:shikimate kinase
MAEAEPPRRIVLVGFMGSGKSTVGAGLARLLGWRMLDMDTKIEQESGLRVSEIFRRCGEPFFRERERQLALALEGRDGLVVAAGGGAFATPATREALRAGAATVWLRCGLETILGRIVIDGSRPLASSRETIRRLLAERELSYRLADLPVDASRSPEAVAREIADRLFAGRAAQGPGGRGRE